MTHLHIDASFGLGGDMLLAGLLSLAGGESACHDLASTLAPCGMAIRLELAPIARNGMAGVGLAIDAPGGQPLRHLSDLLAILDRLDLSASLRTRSARAFTRLAETEAAVHGMDPEQVHFHEVGAVDTLVDVLGVFWCLERLDITHVSCTELPWFTGTVRCAHGELPLPAPATLALMQGKPVRDTAFIQEMITPTGALLLDQIVTSFGQGPTGVVLNSSLSYGQRDTGGGLRLVLLEAPLKTTAAQERVEQVMVLESTVDHLTGEELGDFFEAIMDAGALDVLFTPGVMKKNRPGGQLQVMCRPQDLDRIRADFFRHSLSLGIRISQCTRVVLPRQSATVDTPLGNMQGKRFQLENQVMEKPEFEALKQLATKMGRSVAELRMMMGMAGHEQEGGGE